MHHNNPSLKDHLLPIIRLIRLGCSLKAVLAKSNSSLCLIKFEEIKIEDEQM